MNKSEHFSNLNVVALSGGVGGAKLIKGLDRVLPAGCLTTVVNTGDDFFHFGLKICPDLDSVCYALADMEDESHGWGLENETWNVLESLRKLEAPDWFNLGDRDLATHLERTRLISEGRTLTEITARFCDIWRIKSKVLPMSDQIAPTMVETDDGQTLTFQEYFVKLQCAPKIRKISFPVHAALSISETLFMAIEKADFIIFTPSNPWLSIDPILMIPGMMDLISKKPGIAVSPIIQGKAIKGPAAKMIEELGLKPSATEVLKHYNGIIKAYVFDELDGEEFDALRNQDIIKLKANTIMRTDADKQNLADFVLDSGSRLIV